MLKFSGWVRTSVLPKSDRRYLRKVVYEGTFNIRRYLRRFVPWYYFLARAHGWDNTRTHNNPIKNADMFLHGGLDPPTLALHRRVNLPTAIFRKYKRIFDI